MDVSGLVVASSERISLEHCVGLLFMLYNAHMDIYFYILAKDGTINIWKNVYVNQYYKISDLKVGALETSSGGKVILFKTTDKSALFKMDKLQFEKFEIMESLKSFICVPSIDALFPKNAGLEFSFISYQGFVTEVKNSNLGVYELDFKVLLYTTFNTSCLHLIKGSEIIVSNVHLIKNYKGTTILVCCGLSCVKDSSAEINKESLSFLNDLPSINFCIQYGLSIFDLLWFETLLSSLERKFDLLVIDEEMVFNWNSNCIKNILDYFLYDACDTMNKKLSLSEEFFSNPHKCFPFMENRLPTSCCVPYLSDIVNQAFDSASWIDVSQKWKFSVKSQDHLVIIGVLCTSTNGDFCIADKTLQLPVVISPGCDDCCHEEHILKEFESSELASLVAIHEFDIIFESISCKSGVQQSFQYLRTAFCRVHSLFPIHKSVQGHRFISQDSTCELDIKYDKNTNKFCNNLHEINHRFLVLSKIWTLQSKVPHSSRVLVLFLPTKFERVSSFNRENNSILEDTFGFHDSEDDVEFANLMNGLNFLRIEEKVIKIGYLCFEDTSQNNVFFPGHIYSVCLKDNKKLNFTFEKKDDTIFTWIVNQDFKIIHDPVCLGNHCIEDYEGAESHGIKEILLKRQMSQNWIVTCILKDKMYEDVEKDTECESGNKLNATLCLIVKDVNSDESSLKVYAPHFSGSLYGLLPGSLLQLFGFLCFCSQGGILYLRASSVFGIVIKQPKTYIKKSRPGSMSMFSNSVLHRQTRLQSGSIFHVSLKNLCFVVKIISAEIFLACNKCGRSFQKRCSCYTQKNVKIEVSALIDDGSQLLLALCSDETAKRILSLSQSEWQGLISFSECTHQFLKFSDKGYHKSVLSSVMNQVFNAYCSSKATSRKLMLEYIYIPKFCSSITNIPTVWCKSIKDIERHELVNDLYLKLVKNDRSQK